MAKAARGQSLRGPQPGRPASGRPVVGPPAGAGERNYFASVIEELRKVVWPAWNELGRMTGVVVTTVILMALLVSAADFALGKVVHTLYTPSSAATTTQKGSTVHPNPTVAPSHSAPATSAPATSAPGGSAPVTP